MGTSRHFHRLHSGQVNRVERWKLAPLSSRHWSVFTSAYTRGADVNVISRIDGPHLDFFGGQNALDARSVSNRRHCEQARSWERLVSAFITRGNVGGVNDGSLAPRTTFACPEHHVLF